MGPSTVLTKAEEAMLAAFCIKFLKCGFPIIVRIFVILSPRSSRQINAEIHLRMAGQAFAGFRVLCDRTLNLQNDLQKC